MNEAGERARGPVWVREAGKRRSALSREAIVDTAVALADAEGLAAVSIRRVAGELGARAMSLYTHIERKEDLLDLMFDKVASETCVAGGLPPGWREGVSAISRATRNAMLRHPWMVDLAAQRPKIGPNSLRHGEQSLTALAGLDLDDEAKGLILTAADDYTLGHTIREVSRGVAVRRDGGSQAEREALLQPYISELMETGDFPNLARFMKTDFPGAVDNFERGLKWLLDGLAADLSLP
ncbi:TetR/AcrR family transcriptional regulator [Sphaerisporangium corydalis]|uniref:TetR/AcrR family transcriptional regulator C-terminal domain-containing protein n=1 Tax=Sphaerisporangium corydalis TaxID=1441875 RepID=A0ABV9ENB5_9ACTN|nr:TetR/AcrR family transcriptional regulator [Sphaerisporangium corydalis]